MKKYIILILTIMTLCFSSCDEQEYSWKPEESASSSRITTGTDLSNDINPSSSADRIKTENTTKPSQTPISDEEEKQMKEEMDAILDELMGID